MTAVHASAATRARQTAAPIAAAHGLAVEVLDGVHEVFVGDLEGRSDVPARTEFDAVYEAWGGGDLDARLPGGESAQELRERFIPAVKAITAEVRGTVVLVSHGAAIRIGAAALLGDTVETGYVPNTGLVPPDFCIPTRRVRSSGTLSSEFRHAESCVPARSAPAAGR